MLDRLELGDSGATIQRCALLLNRVEDYFRMLPRLSTEGLTRRFKTFEHNPALKALAHSQVRCESRRDYGVKIGV